MKLIILFLLLVLPYPVSAEDTQCPMHASHHNEQVDARGDIGMGFDHLKSTHHFLINEKGGTIEAYAKDSSDTQTRDQIRTHFQKIAKMFAEGNFDLPMFIHGQEPPGVPQMKSLIRDIQFEYQERPAGGIVKISTENAEALTAVHDFLNFQIREHRTGDAVKNH